MPGGLGSSAGRNVNTGPGTDSAPFVRRVDRRLGYIMMDGDA